MNKLARNVWFGALFALPSSVVIGPGCTVGHEYCELQCDCTHCSDRALDECVVARNADSDAAEAYDCSAEFDAANECYADNFSCDEGENAIDFDPEDCEDEDQELGECIADATDHGNGSGPGPTTTGPGPGAGGGGVGGGGVGGGATGDCAEAVNLCVSCGFGDQAGCEASYGSLTGANCDAAIQGLQQACG